MSSSNENIVLVDELDRPSGQAEKMKVHREGLLHRAVSVCIFNSRGEWLLQQRAYGKYHSGGLWSNACCTHPYPDEPPVIAAGRRLKEEMGLNCILKPWFSFIYRAELDAGLIEHEYDYVFYGFTDDKPVLNTEEVIAWKWMDNQLLINNLREKPQHFTVWFRLLVYRVQGQIPALMNHRNET